VTLNVYRDRVRIEPKADGGMPTLRGGDQFPVTVRNGLDVPLYANFVDVDLEGGRMAALRPSPKEEDKVLKPGESHEFFLDEPWKVDAANHQGRHQLRVVATSSRIDLEPLIAKDGRRGSGTTPVEYIEGSIKKRAGAPVWATATVVFRVPAPGE
jgi:hypothetical protein